MRTLTPRTSDRWSPSKVKPGRLSGRPSKPTAMNEKQVVITLSEADYRLLQQALCAAQIHPDCSEAARKKFADLGWAIHFQTQY